MTRDPRPLPLVPRARPAHGPCSLPPRWLPVSASPILQRTGVFPPPPPHTGCMTRRPPSSPRLASWCPLLVAVGALVMVSLALDPAGDRPDTGAGPGITLDEPFHVAHGVELASRLLAGDFSGLRRVDSRLTDHPPLGRLFLGAIHELAFLALPPTERSVPYSIRCARFGSALLFALTVWQVGCLAREAWGVRAGLVASCALVLMPRSFGHAHLASLETPVNLGYLLCLAAALRRSLPGQINATGAGPTIVRPPDWTSLLGNSLLVGLWLGVTLLIKMQAVFLPVVLAVWGLLWFRGRAVPWLVGIGVVSGLIFLVGWPHLWSDPWTLAVRYFTRSTQRLSLLVWYGGGAVADRDVPWHYPLLIFGLSVPLGWLALGSLASFTALRNWSESRVESLLIIAVAIPLLVFSLPGVPVYDGERLFSVVYPPWAILAGRGAVLAQDGLRRRWSSLTGWPGQITCLTVLLLTQSVGLVRTAPHWLQYYNLGGPGLPGAVRNGFSPGYWADGVTRDFLEEVARQVPPGSQVQLAPILYTGQADELLGQCQALQKRGIRLVPRSVPPTADSVYTILYNRPEYLPEQLRNVQDNWVLVHYCEGVWQAALIREP